MRFRTILFDFDGTLSPSLPCWLGAFRSVLDDHGQTVPDSEIVVTCFFKSWESIGERYGIGAADDVRAQVHEHLAREFETVVLYDGAADLIDRCRQSGVAVGVVTSCPRRHVTAALERTDLLRRLDIVIASEDCHAHKPDPAPIQLALTRLAADPSTSLFVGDHHYDILAGRAAGCATALYLPPESAYFYDTVLLHASKPDVIVTNYYELECALGEGW